MGRIILKLVETEPSERYASAQEVILAINEGLGTEFEVETPATSEGYVLTARLVGRDGELARLREIFHASVEPASAPYGRVPTLALLTGDPGVGKTRLAKELRWAVQLRGSTFIECAPDSASGSPLGFLSTAIDRLLAMAGEESPVSGERGTGGPESGSSMEEIATGSREDDPTEDPTALFERIARFLVRISLKQPYVLCIRDIHLLGPAHAELLGQLVRSVNLWRREGGDGGQPLPGPPRLMLLATADRQGLTGSAAVQKTLGSMEMLNLVERMNLAPLGEPQVAELVESLIGPGDVVGHLARALFTELGGNPLSVIEAMKFLLGEGVLEYRGGGWIVDRERLERPGGIPAVSRAFAIRAGQLDPGGRRVLNALAVIDDRAGLEMLEAVLASDPQDLLRRVRSLEKAGFVEGLTSGPRVEYALVHPRLQEVLYEEIEEGEKGRLHAAVAAHLEAASSGGERAVARGRMAVHYARAGDQSRAREHARAASDHFRKTRLHGEAARYLELLLQMSDTGDERRVVALDLATQLCNASENQSALEILEREFPREDSAMAADLRLNHLLARAYSGLGKHDRALGHLEAMQIEPGPEALEGMPLVSLTLRANILTHLTRYDLAQEVCEASLAALEAGGPDRSRALVLDCLAFLYRAKGDLKASLTYQERVMEITRRLEDKSLSFQNADGMCVIHSMLGNYRESIRHGREAVRLASGMGDLQAEATSYGNLAMSFTALGRFRTALRLFKHANRRAERIGDIHKLGVSFFNIANVLDGLKHRAGREGGGPGFGVRGPHLLCVASADAVGRDRSGEDPRHHEGRPRDHGQSILFGSLYGDPGAPVLSQGSPGSGRGTRGGRTRGLHQTGP
jgi:tetratricopeptide (TPR) repeat protein